jgi:hypothetical protein
MTEPFVVCPRCGFVSHHLKDKEHGYCVRCRIFAEDEMRISEPHIIINGQPLTIAQAMTVRVAIGEFLLTLQDEDFMRDLGPIGPHYKERLIEIAKLMVRP